MGGRTDGQEISTRKGGGCGMGNPTARGHGSRIGLGGDDTVMTASFARTIRAAVAGAGNCASSRVQDDACCRALGDDAISVPFSAEGGLPGGVRTHVGMRREVENSPNATAMALAAICCAAIGRDKGIAGPAGDVRAFLFKHPPVQVDEAEGRDRLPAFAGDGAA